MYPRHPWQKKIMSVCRKICSLVSFTWSHWRTSAAKVGVNCMMWVNDRPSKSRMTVPPQICVVGSSIEAAIVTWTARKRSGRLHFDGFHRSERAPEMNLQFAPIHQTHFAFRTYFRIRSREYGNRSDLAAESVWPVLARTHAWRSLGKGLRTDRHVSSSTWRTSLSATHASEN